MSVFSRRKFIVAALSSAACGGSEMAPIWLPPGANTLDPRQPKLLVDPRQPKLPVKNVIYTQQPISAPVHLSGSLVLRSGSNGAVPAGALKNPMGQDMELLEIKFEISGANDDEFDEVFGGTIWCDLTMGGVKVTNGAIPVWNFGRSENFNGEQQTDSVDDISFVSYSWRLPRPLFVPAGAALIPSFTHTGLIPAALNVRVGYSGRTVVSRPKKIYVPWVAKYVSKSFNPVNDAGVDQSSELDLVNSNPEVLHLQRFTGRTLVVNSDGTMEEGSPVYFGCQTLTVRMTDSYGRPIVRSYTPFCSVFSPLTRSWELDDGTQLDPESFYRVQLKVAPVTLDAGQTAAVGAAGQAFIAMIGWRELENS